jgi:hypothetical protein
MSTLKARIARQGRHPHPARPVTGGAVPGPSATPSHALAVMPGGGAGLTPLTPLITSDGAEIPAAGPGGWDQLNPAGRPR